MNFSSIQTAKRHILNIIILALGQARPALPFLLVFILLEEYDTLTVSSQPETDLLLVFYLI